MDTIIPLTTTTTLVKRLILHAEGGLTLQHFTEGASRAISLTALEMELLRQVLNRQTWEGTIGDEMGQALALFREAYPERRSACDWPCNPPR